MSTHTNAERAPICMNESVPEATADTAPLGLTSSEADRRLRELGEPEDSSSRSVRSIVIANVFTLFNAIVLFFFILVISQGLFADALFGLIREALPERLYETAYALACDVVTADGRHSQVELRMLEEVREELKIDRLHAAAIEWGARVRHMGV